MPVLCAVALVTVPGDSSAAVGIDPEYFASCAMGVQSVTAKYLPDGGISYSLEGVCGLSPFSGRAVFKPGGSFQERFYVAALSLNVSTTGTCPDDPLATGATCRDTSISLSNESAARWLQPYKPPLIAAAIVSNTGNVGLFQNARRNATRPNPPAAPVSVSSLYKPGNRTASVGWVPPDESGDRPYLTFHVDIRPRGAEGGAWTKVSTYARQSVANYSVLVSLPAYPMKAGGWDLRVCSATALATTCSDSQVPQPADWALESKSAVDSGGVSSVPAASPPASSPGQAIKNMGRWKPKPQ